MLPKLSQLSSGGQILLLTNSLDKDINIHSRLSIISFLLNAGCPVLDDLGFYASRNSDECFVLLFHDFFGNIHKDIEFVCANTQRGVTVHGK